MSRSVPTTLQELMDARGITLTDRVDRVAAYARNYLITCDQAEPYLKIKANGTPCTVPDLNLLERCIDGFYYQCWFAFNEYNLMWEKDFSTGQYLVRYENTQQWANPDTDTSDTSEERRLVYQICNNILTERSEFIAEFGETVVTPITGLTVNKYYHSTLKEPVPLKGSHFIQLDLLLQKHDYTLYATSTNSYYLHPVSHTVTHQDFEDLVDKELFKAASQGINTIECYLLPTDHQAIMLCAHALEAGDRHNCQHPRQELADYAQQLGYDLDYKIYHWKQGSGPSLAYMTERGISINYPQSDADYRVEISFSVTNTTNPASQELAQRYNTYHSQLTTRYKKAVEAVDYVVQHPDHALTENDSPLLFSTVLELPVTRQTTDNLKQLVENTPYDILVYDTYYRLYHRDSIYHPRNLAHLAQYYHRNVPRRLWHSASNSVVAYTHGLPRDERMLFDKYRDDIMPALTALNDQQYVTHDDVDDLRQAITKQWNPQLPFLTLEIYIGQHHLADDITAELLHNSLYTPLLRDYFVLDVSCQLRWNGWAEITLAAKPTTSEDITRYVTDIFTYLTQRCRDGFDVNGLEPEDITWENYEPIQATFGLALSLYLRQQEIITISDKDRATLSNYAVSSNKRLQLSDVLVTLDNAPLAEAVNTVMSDWFTNYKETYLRETESDMSPATPYYQAHRAFFERIYRCLDNSWQDTTESIYYAHTIVRFPRNSYYKSYQKFFEECIEHTTILDPGVEKIRDSQHVAKRGRYYDELTGENCDGLEFYAL